jgi:4-amino-4-deoxy-L-arabinose transferase-like glycosyltransferase
LLAILLLATFLRVYDLKELPPGLFCDEAGNGYNAYSLLETGRDENGALFPLYIWSFGVAYKNPVFIYAAAVPIAALGLNEASVRLTSALFGILAVLGIAVLGCRIGGLATGLLAALMLAVCPWHLHFSRIAFELIAFPSVFLFAFAALVAGVRGRPRMLPVAAGLFSLCLYTYGPAKLFVPLFVLAAVLLYARRLWAVARWTLIAGVVAAAVALPVVVFDIAHRDRSQQYLKNTTSWQSEQTLQENATRVAAQYRKFFEPRFLFEQGESLLRHALPGFGELPWALAPLLAVGVLWALWWKNPEGKLVLWWLLLYPIAPSLMDEVPSASRGFIGAAGFSLLAAGGAGALLKTVRVVLRRPLIVVPLQVVTALALLAVLGEETWRYWQAYTTTYPAQAADAFQYGYRQTIDYMESRRGDYDLLLLTANDVNQPQIFAAFYRPVAPQAWQRSGDPGYLIIDPAEYDRYRMDQRILAALRQDDLRLFDDYTELQRVLRPGGEVEFIIAELHVRRRFLRQWLLLGPFPSSAANLNPGDLSLRGYSGAFGTTYWRRTMPQFVEVNLNDFYGRTAEEAGRALSGVCAYAATQIEVPAATRANFEIYGPGTLRGWVNGEPFTPSGARLAHREKRYPIALRPGANEILLQVCKSDGDWRFTARLTGEDEHDLPGFSIHARLGHATRGASQSP